MTGDAPMKDLEKLSEEGTIKIFDHLDINKDGVITMEEFVQGVKLDPSIIKLLTKEAVE